MNDKDQLLMEQAYEQIQEGMLDRFKAKSGTRFANLGAKALGAISNVAGDSRLGRTAKELHTSASMDVEEKRAAKLLDILSTKIENLYAEFKADAQKIGVDVDKLANVSQASPEKYPALDSFAKTLRSINAVKDQAKKGTPKVNVVGPKLASKSVSK